MHPLQVVRAQSTEGLSLVSNIVELLCYTIIVAYNLNHVRRMRKSVPAAAASGRGPCQHSMC